MPQIDIITMSEAQHQKEYVTWFRRQYPKYSRSLRLSLNGVNLPKGKTAAIMINSFKSQGMVTGESDLFIAVPKGKYSGLFIEMKKIGGRATGEQLEYLSYMFSMGYQTAVCEGFNDAILQTKAYLK